MLGVRIVEQLTEIELAVIRGTPAESARHSRRAFCTIVSKTGRTSVGELLITSRISLVALCPAALRPPSSRRIARCILNCDDGLVLQSLQQRGLLVGERLWFSTTYGERPIAHALSEHGTERVWKPASRAASRYRSKLVGLGGLDVADLKRLAIENGPTGSIGRATRGGRRLPAIGPKLGHNPITSPSRSWTMASTASQTSVRCGRWCRAPAADLGELRSLRISAVAVCCSSASVSSRSVTRSSLNSRTFSMAITA